MAILPNGYEAVQAKAQRDRVTLPGEFDGLAGQGLRLAFEEGLHSERGAVAGTLRATGWVAALALLEGFSVASHRQHSGVGLTETTAQQQLDRRI